MVDSRDDDYVDVLSSHIRLQPANKNEIIRELEGHLEDKASDLVSLGVNQKAAKRQALQQMGDPIALARQLQEVHTSAGLKELGLAVIPHLLVLGTLEFGLWDSTLAVAAALALIGGVTWLNWKLGNPIIRPYPWLGFTLAAPSIFLLMLLFSPDESVRLALTGDIYPISTSLILLSWGYVAAALWVMVWIVRRAVRPNWLLLLLSPFKRVRGGIDGDWLWRPWR